MALLIHRRVVKRRPEIHSHTALATIGASIMTNGTVTPARAIQATILSRRDSANAMASKISAIFAIASLIVGAAAKAECTIFPPDLGSYIVAFWVLLPPLW